MGALIGGVLYTAVGPSGLFGGTSVLLALGLAGVVIGLGLAPWGDPGGLASLLPYHQLGSNSGSLALTLSGIDEASPRPRAKEASPCLRAKEAASPHARAKEAPRASPRRRGSNSPSLVRSLSGINDSDDEASPGPPV